MPMFATRKKLKELKKNYDAAELRHKKDKVNLIEEHNKEYRKVVSQFQAYVAGQSNVRRGPSLEPIDEDEAGFTNAYKDYLLQIEATRSKYNSCTDIGQSLVRAIVDLRTAFITGEEIAISSDNGNFVNWAEDFMKKNSFQSNVYIPSAKWKQRAEMDFCVNFIMDLTDDNVEYIQGCPQEAVIKSNEKTLVIQRNVSANPAV